jgi:uncharacterized protein YfaS (alpha-2-macroglobulin family)
MKTQQKPVIFLALITIGIIISSILCSPLSLPWARTTPSPSLPTNTPSPTPKPTNDVVIVDDGAPLTPKVIWQEPGKGQDLPLDGVIELTFDQPMDRQSLESAWSLTSQEGDVISGRFEWPSTLTVRFIPDQKLLSGSEYKLDVATSAASQDGITLSDPLSVKFATVGDLQISQVFPSDRTREVESSSIITVMFNRPVVPLLIIEEQANLPDPLEISPPLSGTGKWLNTSVYIFEPDEALRSATTYDVRIAAGLTDTVGASLQVDYSWQFSTAEPTIGELILPKLVTSPENYYFNVPLEQDFVITFRQPMDQQSVQNALSLTTIKGEPVQVDMEWDEDSTRVTITPGRMLSLGTDYHLLLTRDAQAKGGGSLREGLDWYFVTVMPPAVYSTWPANGSVQTDFSNRVEIQFASPMNLDSIKDKIIFSPELQGEPSTYFSSWNWTYTVYGLRPSTKYTVTILPGTEDLYGNRITEEYSFTFTTAAYRPSASLNMPYKVAMYRVGGDQKFYATLINVDRVEYELYELSTNTFAQMITGDVSRWNHTPPRNDLLRSWEVLSNGDLNERFLDKQELKSDRGGKLSSGFYFLTIDSSEVRYSDPYIENRLIMVASANLTLKATPTEALIWVTDLESGEPLADVPVVVYDSDFVDIQKGVTDSDGLLYLEDVEDAYFAVAEDDDVFGFSALQWGSGVSPYDFGIWADYYSDPDDVRVYVYTERPLYRPGQPVYFKGIVRANDDLDYSLPRLQNVQIVISNYDEMVHAETLSVNEFGSFSGEFTLAEDAVLGSYAIEIKSGEEPIGGVNFSVAEYRRPEFQVEVTTDQFNVLNGEEFTITVEASYFSGGGVADADVEWILRAEDYVFRPGGPLSRYNFTDIDRDRGYDYYHDFGTSSGEVIAEGSGKTNSDGELVVTLPADLSEAGISRTFTFEATITDVAGTTVSGRESITAHLSSVYAGVRVQQYIGRAGREAGFDLVVVDWDAKTIPGHNVDVEIVERRWSSVQVQDAQGYFTWETSVEEIPVEMFENIAMDADGKAEVSFVPPNGGVYKAIVTTRDDKGNPNKASAYLWVAGEDYIPWRQTNDRSFELITDKDKYEPGDTAQILIASPFSGQSYALITVERGHIRQREVIKLTTNSTIYDLPITADMAPNMYVSVLIIKGVDRENDKPDFKMSMIELEVAADQQTLNVEITPDKEQAGPGETVTYAVIATDNNGNPVQAEISLSLSDLSTLTLLGPNSLPIRDFFYEERNLRVRTAVPIVNSIEEYNEEVEETAEAEEAILADGYSGGGKGLDDFGVFEVRQDFPDTAFWQAHVLTDANGEASVTVTLPDNLTIWRMDARAITKDTLAGSKIFDLRSTKPLLVRPQTPRFFVVNDHVRLGAAVHNNSETDFTAAVSLLATGLFFEDEVEQQIQVPAGQQVFVTWNVVVEPDAERIDMVFHVEGGGYEDASRPTLTTLEGGGLPVYRYEVPETVATGGMLTEEGSVTEAVVLPEIFDISQGDLTIRIAPSLVAGVTEGLDYLKHYPYECIEQTISRFLPNVLTTKALKAAGLSDPDLEANLKEQVSVGLQRIYNRQRADGGWGWWPNRESDLLTSTYVVFGLVEAEEAGYSVDTSVVDKAVNYLLANVADVNSLDADYLLNRQSFLLYVLTRAGQPQVSRAVQLFDVRQSLSLYGRAYLVQTLYLIDPSDTRINTVISDFANAAFYSATGVNWEEGWRDYWNWNTDTRTTAIVLGALTQVDPENGLNANAVRWLMSHRTNGHWASTQETAWSLIALTRWMVATGELQANYDYAFALNGVRVDDGSANAETLRQVHEIQVDILELLRDEVNRLVIARDAGEGNLYYTAHLNVFLPVEEVEPLDSGIIISRSYYEPDDRESAVTKATQGDLLLARLTVVVPKTMRYVIIEDMLPAGMEAVDQSLETSQQESAPELYTSEEVFTTGWGWWYFDHVELRDERVVISADYLPAGTYIYTYLVRAGLPGEFRVIPPVAQEFYFPEVYGRGAGSLFTITP